MRPSRLSRGPALGAILALLGTLLSGRLSADRNDQRAADDYRRAVALVEKGRYEEAIPLLLGAIARAPEPNEAQGSERRFRTRYDPYYWLGVAQMELGREDEALTNFERSDSVVAAGYAEPVIRRWEKEYADLKRRRALLLSRLHHAPEAIPTSLARAPSPSPSPQPATPLPVRPTATPAMAIPAPGLDPSSPLPATRDDAAVTEARELKARLDGWGRHPRVGSDLAPLLAASRARLERLLASASPSSGELELATRDVKVRLRAARSRLRALCLRRIGEDFTAQRWDEAFSTLELARQLYEGASEHDLLSATILSTRYLMEGSRNERDLDEARKLFRAWRARAGENASVPKLVSPSLAGLLEPQSSRGKVVPRP